MIVYDFFSIQILVEPDLTLENIYKNQLTLLRSWNPEFIFQLVS